MGRQVGSNPRLILMPRKRSYSGALDRRVTRERGRKTPKTKDILVKHALKRAFERYDAMLSPADIEAMNRKIRSNEGQHVERQSSTRTVWIVPYGDARFAVVYNKALSCIVTFLPKYVMERTEDSEG
jgi:hypothetical protein